MRTYTIQRHPTSGEVYALRYLDNVITGCIGPLYHDNITAIDLPGLDWASGREDVAWAAKLQWNLPLVTQQGWTQ